MAGVVRLNDTSSHGGRMVTASGDTNANGWPLCRSGDLHQCPIPGHGTTPVNASQGTARCNGAGILQLGDTAGCGASIVSCSPNVNVP